MVGSAAILVASSRVVLDGVVGRLEVMELIGLIALIAVPIAVMAGLLRARLARSAVGDILVELGEARPPRTSVTQWPARSAIPR